ncbi:MAG: universal stress protein [Candidatus Marinimicrobia bacterium]|nr:universal stress protein [bacterium]MCG2716781.1 universal stress protein [Candidatus Neomarinimicrobiota bacterium]
MFPLKKVLCPIDFSEHSLKALKIADEMAKTFHAEIFLVNIIPPIPSVPTPPHPFVFDIPKYQDSLEINSKKSLDDIAKKHVSSGIKVHQIISCGDPAQEIIKIADENDVNLIVVATHGRTGLKHMIFGSVAEKIIRHASCPVLTKRVL